MLSQLPRNVLIGLAVLLWAGLASVWLVPPLLDWNRYRADISGYVSRELGQDLEIAGPVHLVLLPQPLLVADDVSLNDAGDNLSLHARELRLRVAFWPLLSGRVEAQELVLRGFSARTGWPLGRLAGHLQPPSWLAALAARIEDGEVQIGNVALRHLDATLRLLPETGGIALTGRGGVAGQDWNVDAHLTRAGGDGVAGLDLSLDGRDKAAGNGAKFAGRLAADGGLVGRLSLHGNNAALFSPLLSGPFKAEAELQTAGQGFTAQDITAELAGSSLRGSAKLTERLEASFTAPRLDLDAALKLLLSDRPTWPAGLRAHLQIGSEAASLLGGTLRQFRSTLDLSAAETTIADLRAQLPGAAQFVLSGRLHPQATPDLLFSGHAALAAPALRDTLAWLDAAGLPHAQHLPDILLRRAELQSDIAIESGEAATLHFDKISGLADATHLQGSLTLHPGTRLGIAATLDLDRIDADALFAGKPSLAALTAPFGQTDLDLKLHILQTSFDGETLSPVLLDAAFDASRLSLHKFEAQLPGARVTISGALGSDGSLSEGRLDAASTADAMPTLLAHLPTALAAHIPAQAANFQLLGEGKQGVYTVRATLDIGDLHMRAGPQIDLAQGTWHGSWALRHAGASRLLEDFGFPGTRTWLGEGSASASGTLSGQGPLWAPTTLQSDGFDLALGQLRLSGALQLDFAATPKLSGRLAADVLTLPLPGLRSPDPLPWQALAGWQADLRLSAGEVQGLLSPLLQQVSATLALNDGVLRLTNLAAQLAGGQLAGNITLDSVANPSGLSGDVALSAAKPAERTFDLPIDLLGGQLSGNLAFAANGFSPAALLATLSGSLALTWNDGTLDGIDLGRMAPRLEDSDLRLAMLSGSTSFTQASLSADLHDGSVVLSKATLSGPAGSLDATGLIDLVGRSEELRLSLSPAVPTPPRLSLRLSGSIDSPTRTPDFTDAARWRALYFLPPPPPAPRPAPPPPSKPAAAPQRTNPTGSAPPTPRPQQAAPPTAPKPATLPKPQ